MAAAPVAKSETPAAALAKPQAAAPLDLKSLETRLEETSAIGVFTKLTLKNQIDELLERFRAFYQGKLKTSLADLRRSYDMLVLKVLALLQDADPPLAGAIGRLARGHLGHSFQSRKVCRRMTSPKETSVE